MKTLQKYDFITTACLPTLYDGTYLFKFEENNIKVKRI